MAATPDLDDPLLDLIGQSLFDVIEEKNRTLNKVSDYTCDAKVGGVILSISVRMGCLVSKPT